MYLVQLDGTWERTNTDGSDVALMRRKFITHGPGRGISGTFTVSKKLSTGNTKRGKFVAKVSIPAGAFGMLDASRRARARTLLTWFLQDVTCRPPVIKVTNVRTINA